MKYIRMYLLELSATSGPVGRLVGTSHPRSVLWGIVELPGYMLILGKRE